MHFRLMGLKMGKCLVLLGIHGAGGAGKTRNRKRDLRGRRQNSSYRRSPSYPWGYDRSNYPKIQIFDDNVHSEIASSIFWESILSVAEQIERKKVDYGYSSVAVVLDKGTVGKRDCRYVKDIVKHISDKEDVDSIEIVTVGKSLGCIHSLWALEELMPMKLSKNISAPYSIMVDPDNFVNGDYSAISKQGRVFCVIPKIAQKVDVFREKSVGLNESRTFGGFLLQGLFGRILGRRKCDRTDRFTNVRHFMFDRELQFPTDLSLFPDTDELTKKEFAGKYVNHWRIDEYMAIFGWNGMNIEKLLMSYFNTKQPAKLSGEQNIV